MDHGKIIVLVEQPVPLIKPVNIVNCDAPQKYIGGGHGPPQSVLYIIIYVHYLSCAIVLYVHFVHSTWFWQTLVYLYIRQARCKSVPRLCDRGPKGILLIYPCWVFYTSTSSQEQDRMYNFLGTHGPHCLIVNIYPRPSCG